MATRTQIATDSFTRADGSPGSDWLQLETSWGTMAIDTNKIRGGNAYNEHERKQAIKWVGAGTFTNDQYSSVVISGLAFQNAGCTIGVVVRASSDQDTAKDAVYAMVCADSAGPNYTTKFVKIINGTATELYSTTVAWTDGDRIEMEAIGGTITVMKNGTALGGSFTSSDADFSGALSTGGVGVMGSSIMLGDDWIGGNMSSATAVPVFMNSYKQRRT